MEAEGNEYVDGIICGVVIDRDCKPESKESRYDQENQQKKLESPLNSK